MLYKISKWLATSGPPKLGQVGVMADTQGTKSNKGVRGGYMNSKGAIGGHEMFLKVVFWVILLEGAIAS